MRSATRQHSLLPAAVMMSVVSVIPPNGLATAPSAIRAPVPSSSHHHPRGRIRHVIEIMLENHTTYNLFGFSCQQRRIAPPDEGDVQGGVGNSRAAEIAAMNARPGKGYLMDRYRSRQAHTVFGPGLDPNLQYLAGAYELADHNFQPVIGPTQPNVMAALSGTAYGWYVNRPYPQPEPWHSIFDELTAHHRSWKIYFGLPRRIRHGTIWHQIIPPARRRDLVPASRFFTNLSSGHLPSFSFIRPGVGYSEEPREDIGEGDAWLGQLVRAVARSHYWSSTAIFVTYDEGGGFWDPVAPPVSSGHGTRTPLVIVSPWARLGVFRHATTNLSVLSFMQHLWHMPALNSLNRRQPDLAGAFSFGQRPLPPPRLPVAPRDTIAFHGATDLREVHAARPHHWLRVNLAALTGGLALDRRVSGRVTLTVTPPAGVTVLAPAPVRLRRGRASLRMRFPAAGYYRIAAAGPGGSLGWTTVVVVLPGG